MPSPGKYLLAVEGPIAKRTICDRAGAHQSNTQAYNLSGKKGDRHLFSRPTRIPLGEQVTGGPLPLRIVQCGQSGETTQPQFNPVLEASVDEALQVRCPDGAVADFPGEVLPARFQPFRRRPQRIHQFQKAFANFD